MVALPHFCGEFARPVDRGINLTAEAALRLGQSPGYPRERAITDHHDVHVTGSILPSAGERSK